MKKILLILALALGVNVNAQIVGGYLPRNSSTSTATIGTIRTNSLVVTASTISVGAKTLTSGNTGTVATRQEIIYSITFYHVSWNPTDGTAIYWGNNGAVSGTSGHGQVMIPYNSTLIGYSYNTLCVAGSAETGTLAVRVNNTTDYNLNTAISFTSAIQTYTSMALSNNYTAGDMINVKMNPPTWATNPTSQSEGVILYFRRND